MEHYQLREELEKFFQTLFVSGFLLGALGESAGENAAACDAIRPEALGYWSRVGPPAERLFLGCFTPLFRGKEELLQ